MIIATFARRAIGAIGVFVLVGAAVVFYWHVEDISPSAVDLTGWLVGLPLALLGGYWITRWAVARSKARAAAAPAAGDVAAGDAPGAADDGVPVDMQLQLLASAVMLPAGSDPVAVAAALVEPKRPSLHATLKDAAGLPVFAAPIEDVDAKSVQAPLRAAHTSEEPFERLFPEERLRAIAALDPVADELLLRALPPAAAEEALETWQAHAARKRVATVEPVLRIRLLLPASWPAAARQTGGDWLQAKAVAIGHVPAQVSVEIMAVHGAGEVWRLVDQLAQAQARQPDPDLQLLLAAHSQLGEESVSHLAAAARLLGSGRPEGLIPGEGAAGLLLAAPSRAIDPEAKPQRLHRIVHGQAGSGRGAARDAARLLERALASAVHTPDRITTVFSDADHRPSRAVEAAGAVAATLPELDPSSQCLHLGVPCGDGAHVMPLALLAVAAAQVGEGQAPVLVLGVADHAARAAVVLSPPPPIDSPDPTAEAPAGAA